MAAFAAACLLLARAAAADSSDSASFRLEIGQRTDVSNEQFVDYEELFVDSTFAGARTKLAGSPERRYGGLATATLAGTRGAGSTRYRLDTETLLGDRLSSARISGAWRVATPGGWRWQLDPEAEYRRDQTFDRDRRETRVAVGGHLRRASGDGSWAGEARARGDLLEVSGSATEYLADRQSATLGAALERLGLLGDWRAGYAISSRAFPDSTERDHVEHALEADGRTVLLGGTWLAVETRLARRNARRPAATSRDDFARAEASLEFTWLAAPAWGAAFTCEGEAIRYDRPDSTVYADARRLRGTLRWHLEPRRGATFRMEAGLERAWSPAVPEEEYLELGAGPGLEWFGGGAWWEVSPRAGRRWPSHADRDALSGGAIGYEFYELHVAADQPLGSALRARITASGRIEEHDDASLDARGLFVSAELRWRVLGRP